MKFNAYVDECLLKSESKIKKLCSPLQDCLDIPIFGYYYLDKTGRYCNISNALGILDHYYGDCVYLNDPYMRNPCFFKTGYSLVEMTSDKNQQEKLLQKYELNFVFQILCKYDDYIEGFLFARKNMNYVDGVSFFNKIYLLEKFARFFKLEAKLLINKIVESGYNMKIEIVDKFDMVDSSISSLSTDENKQFLKKIDPLSNRENECVDLYQEGCSAQVTAARLGISQRTVEHHLDNARLKFGFNSKTQFLNF